MKATVAELRHFPDPDLCMADAVLSGRILVVRGLLRELKAYEEIRAASLHGVGQALGRRSADAVRANDFQSLHDHVSLGDLPRVALQMCRAHHAASAAVLDRIVAPLLQLDRYYFERPSIRIHLPFDRARGKHRALSTFCKANGEGKLAPQGPHRDSWLACPINTINIWVAVGPVRADNGIIIFPDDYALEVPRKGLCVDPSHAPGRPHAFDLEPGDALIFHGEHLHATALNSTPATCHMVSYRLTRTRPRFSSEHQPHFVDSKPTRSGFAQGMLRYVPELPSRLSPSYIGTRLRRLEARARGQARNTETADVIERDVPLEAPSEVRAPARGEIVPYDQDVCLARTDEGRLFAFARRCPHEGTDLAQGHLDGTSVRCPWHNLAYDLETGKSACRSLPVLRRFTVEARDDGSLVVGEEVPERPAPEAEALPLPVAPVARAEKRASAPRSPSVEARASAALPATPGVASPSNLPH